MHNAPTKEHTERNVGLWHSSSADGGCFVHLELRGERTQHGGLDVRAAPALFFAVQSLRAAANEATVTEHGCGVRFCWCRLRAGYQKRRRTNDVGFVSRDRLSRHCRDCHRCRCHRRRRHFNKFLSKLIPCQSRGCGGRRQGGGVAQISIGRRTLEGPPMGKRLLYRDAF